MVTTTTRERGREGGSNGRGIKQSARGRRTCHRGRGKKGGERADGLKGGKKVDREGERGEAEKEARRDWLEAVSSALRPIIGSVSGQVMRRRRHHRPRRSETGFVVMRRRRRTSTPMSAGESPSCLNECIARLSLLVWDEWIFRHGCFEERTMSLRMSSTPPSAPPLSGCLSPPSLDLKGGAGGLLSASSRPSLVPRPLSPSPSFSSSSSFSSPLPFLLLLLLLSPPLLLLLPPLFPPFSPPFSPSPPPSLLYFLLSPSLVVE